MTQAERASELDTLGLERTEDAEELLKAEEAHVAEIDQRVARVAGLVGEEPRERLPERRDTAALEIEQKTAALEALGPIAKEPRARERLEVEVADAERQLDEPATTRPTPAPAWTRTPWTPRRSPRWRSDSPAGPRSWRRFAAGNASTP